MAMIIWPFHEGAPQFSRSMTMETAMIVNDDDGADADDDGHK